MKLQDMLNEGSNISITISINELKEFADYLLQRNTEEHIGRLRKSPKLYTRKEVAKLLHITLPTLSRFYNDGIIPCKRIGSRILFEADEIDKIVKQGINYKYHRHVQTP